MINGRIRLPCGVCRFSGWLRGTAGNGVQGWVYHTFLEHTRRRGDQTAPWSRATLIRRLSAP